MHCFPELDLDELVNVTCHLYPIWDEQTCVPNSPEKLQARASFLCPPACAHLCTSVLISFVSGTKNKGHGWRIIFLEAPCEVVQEHLFPIHPPMELSHHTIPTQHQKHASCPLAGRTNSLVDQSTLAGLTELSRVSGKCLSSGAFQGDKLLLLKSCSNTLISIDRKQGNPARNEH